MCKRLISLVSVVLVLALVGNAVGAVVTCTDAGPDHLWSTAANWDTDTLPTSADKAKIPKLPGPTIRYPGAVAHNVPVGDGSSTGALTVDGGTLTTTTWLILSYSSGGSGTLYMNSDNITVGNHFSVGFEGSGTLNMTGGTITVTNSFAIPRKGAGTGHVNLYGGTITTAVFSMRAEAGAVGTMDITAGTLIIDGDVRTTIQRYIDNGWITAYSGNPNAAVKIDYDLTNPGKTTVTASMSGTVTASNPSPPDGDIIVTSPDDVVLGWTSGISAASHDVYFGTNFDDVKNGTGGTFKASLPLDANSFSPGDLEFDRTYYWRIDEATGPTSGPGDVWSFETAVDFDSRVDCNTLTSKIMAGYQGWFNCPTDGADLGWTHWKEAGSQKFEPGHCSVDMWPDMSEYDEDEKYATLFQHADGSTAYVFSSYNRKTVMRHWKWMYDYGIDGGFLQRFANGTKNSKKVRHKNAVLSHCRDGAKRYGRTYALMYDLSGLGYGEIKTVLMEDFKKLVDQTDLLNDDAYLCHNGRPVVAIWGMGFKDRAYTPAECDELVDFLKNDPTYGGCSVMLGVPSYWRTLTRDCISDPMVHDVILKADIVSPRSVGRFGMSGVNNYDSDVWEPDMTWCTANNLDYLPVVWPGFSWYNLKYPDAPFDSHPRYGGQFLWKQLIEAKKSGATMLYQAMFDEVDESTAIFKCTNDPPVGESLFLADPNLPTDHYLWLSAQGGRLLRGKIEPTSQMPTRY
ncbi:MAG: hypothetical protein ACYTBX_18065 [Planctomycetota bacterium]|jgi:hypothetical protein